MLIEIIQEEGHIWDTLEKNLNSHMNCAQRFDGPHGQIIKGRQKNGVFVCVLVTQSCLTLCNPHTVAHQASLSMEFSRQEYWSGLPFPSPRYLPNIGIKTGPSALQADSLPSETLGTQSIRGTNMSFQSPNSSSWNNRSDFECPDQLIISLVHFRIDTLPEFLSIENGFLGYN